MVPERGAPIGEIVGVGCLANCPRKAEKREFLDRIPKLGQDSSCEILDYIT